MHVCMYVCMHVYIYRGVLGGGGCPPTIPPEPLYENTLVHPSHTPLPPAYGCIISYKHPPSPLLFEGRIIVLHIFDSYSNILHNTQISLHPACSLLTRILLAIHLARALFTILYATSLFCASTHSHTQHTRTSVCVQKKSHTTRTRTHIQHAHKHLYTHIYIRTSVHP